MKKMLALGLSLPLLLACGAGSHSDDLRADLPERPDSRAFASVATASPSNAQDAARSPREKTRTIVTLLMGHTHTALAQ